MMELQLLYMEFLSKIILGQFQVLENQYNSWIFNETMPSSTISETAELSNPYSIKKNPNPFIDVSYKLKTFNCL